MRVECAVLGALPRVRSWDAGVAVSTGAGSWGRTVPSISMCSLMLMPGTSVRALPTSQELLRRSLIARKSIEINQRIGKLVVLAEVSNDSAGGSRYLVQCDCGETRIMLKSNLLRDNKEKLKSCGCERTKHGLWKTRAYESWSGMMRRCYNESSISYERYGGRGIAVSVEWHDFKKFFADMGEPAKGMSIERIDNNADYSKENCKWASAHEQSRNRRSNIIVEHKGTAMCLKDWVDRVGLPYPRVWARINRLGLTPEQALGLEPVQRGPRSRLRAP